MKRFAFRLQTVLDVRRIREDRLRTELAHLCVQEQQQEQRLHELRGQCLQTCEGITADGALLSGTQVLAAWEKEENLRRSIQHTENDRQVLAGQRQAKQQETLDAASQRKMLDHLHDKARMHYLAEAAAATERQLDDLCAVSRSLQ